MSTDSENPQNVADEVTRPSGTPRGHPPRLPPEYYRGHAFVFWTHTVSNRATGWLDPHRHATFRELLLHAAAREQLVCPIYTMMPDHVHLIWIGIAGSSDQRLASTFLRAAFAPNLTSGAWQHQPHDHVLRERDRERGALAATCHYITENPVRAHLVEDENAWPYTGCIVPGYPNLDPRDESYWDLFWRIHATCVERGRVGKM